MKKVLLSLLATSCLFTFYSCLKYNDDIDASYFSVSHHQETLFEDFYSIDAELAANIIYTQGNKFSVTLNCSEESANNLKFKVENQKLKIKCYKNKEIINIYITSPDIKEIDFEGSGNFTSPKKITLNHDLKIEKKGTGDLSFSNIECENCKIEIDGTSSNNFTIAAKNITLTTEGVIDTKIQVDCKIINIDAEGMCSIIVSGETEYCNVKQEGIIKVDTSYLKIKNQ